jgi:hypothetical protein
VKYVSRADGAAAIPDDMPPLVRAFSLILEHCHARQDGGRGFYCSCEECARNWESLRGRVSIVAGAESDGHAWTNQRLSRPCRAVPKPFITGPSISGGGRRDSVSTQAGWGPRDTCPRGERTIRRLWFLRSSNRTFRGSAAENEAPRFGFRMSEAAPRLTRRSRNGVGALDLLTVWRL